MESVVRIRNACIGKIMAHPAKLETSVLKRKKPYGFERGETRVEFRNLGKNYMGEV